MRLLSGGTREAWDKANIGVWVKWFAWHPVFVENVDNTTWSLVWLCEVERKAGHGYSGVVYRYRESIA